MKKNEWLKMKKSSFIEGTLIATLAIVITKIFGMLYVIPFYATVGTKGSALYAYAYNIYVIFLDLSSAGIPVAMSKIIKEYNTLGQNEAKVRAYKLGKKIVTIISLTAFLLLFFLAEPIAYLILGELEGGNSIRDVGFVIRCVSFAILVIPYLSVTKGYLQGHNIINVSSVSQVIEQIVRIAIILGGSYLALNVFHLSLTTSVGIAVFGAFIGGLTAIMYIMVKIKNSKKELGLVKHRHKDKISNHEIVKKIISYAVPFIIIDIAINVYNFVDMVFISRTFVHLGYNAEVTEFVTTSVATWAPKIGMVVTSIAMGLTVSLIPNIVEAFTLKKWKVVEQRINKALQIILVTCLPMVVGISLLARPIWAIFYGDNPLGSSILAMSIITVLFFNLNIITNSTLQSLNKFKEVYLATLIGYLTNALLDIPLMLLFHRLGFIPFYGALAATIIGTSLSIFIALYKIKKEHKLKYKETVAMAKKLVFPTVLMSMIVIGLKMLIPVNYNSALSCIIYVAIISLAGAFIYLTITFKQKTLQAIFGQEYLAKIIKKLTFGKVSLD